MKDFVLTVTDAPSERAQEVIEKGLNGYNAEQASYWDSRPLAVLASDPLTSEVLGGFLGRTSLGLLFIDLVYLPDRVRGSGLGSRMLAMAEAEALERGCRRGVLYTISFQAPGFYERHGWREFGRIPCDPPGTARVFMTKELAPETRFA
ncbi:MAG TPA: GNAT family N-acetyltransferase [Stellaceae bacterium]|nr:GNAT family N-acetyltransferase [Stellaceae bacterium]